MAKLIFNGNPPIGFSRGDDLLGTVLGAGLPVMYLCMAGSCGRCRVRVETGLELLAPPNRAEQHHGCTGPDRLACQARLHGDGEIRIRQ